MKPRQPLERACDKARAILAKYEMDKGVPPIPPPPSDLDELIRRLSAL